MCWEMEQIYNEGMESGELKKVQQLNLMKLPEDNMLFLVAFLIYKIHRNFQRTVK